MKSLILVAEDERRKSASCLSCFLEMDNFNVIVARNGERTPSPQAKIHRPDLILMDVRMPQADRLPGV